MPAMAEWAYKVTPRKRSDPDTKRLAEHFGFLARSAYKRMAGGRAGGRINRVAKVVPGDVLHVYYVSKKSPPWSGSFRVLDPASSSARFAPVWPDEPAALARVVDGDDNRDLLDFLAKKPGSGEGYRHDPKLDLFTGWLVEPLPDRRPPKLEGIFRDRNMLVSVEEGTREEQAASDELLSRIVHDPDVMGGKPCIRGTRVTVGTVLGLLASGHSFATVLADFPYLQEIDVRAALAYAAWRTQEREIPLEAA